MPIQLKSKWYPLILIAIFTIFFGPQFSLFAGMGTGYLYVFGYLKCLETSAPTIKKWEERWPFKSYKSSPSFRQTASALANNPPAGSSNRAQSMGSFGQNFIGGGNSSNTATAGPGSGQPARNDEESKSNFKAFSGKGVSMTSGGSTAGQSSRQSSSRAKTDQRVDARVTEENRN